MFGSFANLKHLILFSFFVPLSHLHYHLPDYLNDHFGLIFVDQMSAPGGNDVPTLRREPGIGMILLNGERYCDLLSGIRRRNSQQYQCKARIALRD